MSGDFHLQLENVPHKVPQTREHKYFIKVQQVIRFCNPVFVEIQSMLVVMLYCFVFFIGQTAKFNCSNEGHRSSHIIINIFYYCRFKHAKHVSVIYYSSGMHIQRREYLIQNVIML